MTTSTDGLVPITRAFLARYYDNYPLPPLPDDVTRLVTDLQHLSGELIADSPSAAEELLAREAEIQPPNKVDENMWKNRENIEEILYMLDKSRWPKSLQGKATAEDMEIAAVFGELEVRLRETLKTLEIFQMKNANSVFDTVMTYLPQDFRGTLIRQQRERSERNRQAEVDTLTSSGGSIRDRYALLWKQQMERRRQLAQLGSAGGVYKTLVKYLVGVPQVLLDFVRQINDDEGPMEEQRQRYGPSLYKLTTMVIYIRLFLLLYLGRFEARKLHKHDLSALQQAVNVYASEFEKFIKFIGEVFANSPFLISSEDAGPDEYKETTIPPGKTHEVTLTVESANSYIAWEFSLIQGTLALAQDIGFHLEYVSQSGEITLILPYRRFESDQGNFCTILPGSYKLKWDNSYSSFFKKNLRYKVDAIPPVDETQQSAAESG